MAENITTDATTLSKEAANFDRISGSIQQAIKSVESTGGSLASHWTGQAGSSAQQALARFHEAGLAQVKALTDIHESISHAGIQYQQTNEEHSQNLQAAADQMLT
jgi:WXG100 family type VII secretion target